MPLLTGESIPYGGELLNLGRSIKAEKETITSLIEWND